MRRLVLIRTNRTVSRHGEETTHHFDIFVLCTVGLLRESHFAKRVGIEGNVEGHEWHHVIKSRMALLRAITTRQVHGSTLEHSPRKIARQFYKRSS